MDSLNCVSSCTGNLGAEFKTSIDKEKCLYPFESCGDAKYFADSSTTYFCTKCDTIITNCEECSSSTICTKCDAGSILIYNTDGSVTCEAACTTFYKLDKVDGNCIINCTSNTNPFFIENSAGNACVDSCEDSNYFLF